MYNTIKKGENKMKFYIDFTGYCTVEAENADEAKEKFANDEDLKNWFFEIDDVEQEDE